MSDTLWLFDDIKPVKKAVLNPRPPVPETGWRRPTSMPSLASARVISIDLETWDPELEDFGPGHGRGVGHIVGVSVSTDDGFVAYYPMRHVEEAEDNFDPQQVLAWCQREFSRPHQTKLGFNLFYDIAWLKQEGVDVVGPLFDCYTAERLICHQNEASLEATAQRRVGGGKSSEDLYRWLWAFYGRGSNPGPKELRKMVAKIAWAPPRLAGPYAESDTTLPLQLMAVQEPLLESLGLGNVFRMEMLLLPVLLKMRMAGVSVDIPAAERADCQFTTDIDVLQKEVNHIAGVELNTGSGESVGKVLTGVGIKCPLTEKTQKPSITGEFLGTVDHPLAEKIVELEMLKKFQTTFIRAYILDANVKGKVFSELKPMQAITGRFSAANPNMTNVPSRNHLAKMVRSIFVPDLGHHSWRKYDYSSVESRLMAHFAVGIGSDDLRAQYNANPNTDYHDWTTEMVKNKSGHSHPRPHIKNINFAKQYGASNRKLASMLKMTLEEADPIFEAFAVGLPYVDSTLKHFSRTVENSGETRTILNRRVGFDLWEPTEYSKDRMFALPFNKALEAYGNRIHRAYTHKASNYVIQGSAADLIKAAMVRCHVDGVYDVTGVPRLVVHDEKDFSVQNDSKDTNEAFREMHRIMETALDFAVPIRVAGEWGPNWGELYKMARFQ